MTNLDKITPQLIENLLKSWQSGNFSEDDVEKVNALIGDAQTLASKQLLLRDFLYELITQNLSSSCLEIIQNSVQKKAEIQSVLMALFQEKATDNQIFALIYCRYLNVQQYQVQELADLARLTPRTLRRYLLKGFEKLSTQIKIELNKKLETGAREHLKKHFPVIEADQVVGIERLLAQLNGWLDEKDAPHAISIEGLGGIGKTLLAQHLIEQRYQANANDDYVWVSARQSELSFRGEISPVQNPVSSLDDIVSRLAENLGQEQLAGFSTEDKLAHLTYLSKKKKLLIVIDNLETVNDVDELVPALLKLSEHSRLIFTSRQSLRQYPSVRTFPVPELSYEDSRALVLGEIKRLGLPFSLPEETMRALYDITGGVPLVLKLASAQFGYTPSQEIIRQLRLGGKNSQNMYSYIYRQAWNLLVDAGKKLLLSMLLVSPDGEDREWICTMGGLTDEEFDIGVDALNRLSLIEFSGSIDAPLCRIHRLTTTFLRTDILQGWESK